MRPRNTTRAFSSKILVLLILFLPLAIMILTPPGIGSQSAFVTVSGGASDDYFGWNVSNAGDVNGDGFDDVIVGAPGYDIERGRAYIFYGGSWFTGAFSAANANVTINGSIQGDRFGWDVSGFGDVNGDGFNDTIIGAPGNNTDTGSAYILFGSSSLPSYLNASDCDVILVGESSGDIFGSSVSMAGDVNDDGFDDVIIGVFGNDTQTGKVCIFYGNDPMLPLLNINDANATFFGENPGDNFGFSVSGAGDVNDDGYDDVVVGVPGADRVYIYFGGDPMNAWVQTTQADFDGGTKVHMKTLAGGEVELETFYDTKAMMAYNGSYSNIPRIRTWDHTTWGSWSDSAAPDADDNYWFELESGTVRKNEKVLGVLDSGLDVNVQVWDGLSWSSVLELVDVSANANYRCFDIAYESNSGDALVAYYNQSSGDLFPKYRTWNGTDWGLEQDAQGIGTGDIYWVVLASNPNSDEILMVTLDANSDIYAQVWDGDAWGDVQVVETNAAVNQYQCFDAVYESQSGHGFIAWSDNLGNIEHRRWKGDWTEAEGSWGTSLDIVRFMKLASEQNSNYILEAYINQIDDIEAIVWDGTTWGTSEMVTTNSQPADWRCFDVAWESKGNKKGLIVYGENIEGPRYRTVNGTTVNTTELTAKDPNPGSGFPFWIKLDEDPQSLDILMMYLVFDGIGPQDDIGVQLWNGTNWTKEQNVEINSTRDNGQRFDLAYTDTSGHLISVPYDAGKNISWGRIRWNADVPLGTTLKLRTRTSPDNSTWSSWSNWYDNGERITSPNNQWIQYQVVFETTNMTLSPTLYDVTIEMNHPALLINGTPGEDFGWSVAWAGDLDKDGCDDIIIGAPQNTSAKGSAYIFHGVYLSDESILDGFIELDNGDIANVTLTGESPSDQFGYSVSYAGDVSIDGNDDIIIGAPDASSNGTIYVFFGSTSMSPNLIASNANFISIGEDTTDSFGWSVSRAGDIDSDASGYDEIIVGAPYFDDGGNTDAGKVYVFHLVHRPDLLLEGSGEDVYLDIPGGAQENITIIVSGTNATWWLELQNDGNIIDTYDFDIITLIPGGWMWELRENASWTIINDGDSITLNPGETRSYTLNISSSVLAVADELSWVTVTIYSQNNTQRIDSINVTAVIEDVLPELSDTTSGTPTTGELFTINATVTDNFGVNEVYVFYWFDLYPAGTLGPFKVLMDPGYTKDVPVPSDAERIYYNISANDFSHNENETGTTFLDVMDNDIPQITDTTSGMPTTGDIFTITATVTDNIDVDSTYLYYWFDLFGGGIDGPHNISMDPAYLKDIDVPNNALALHYNISAKDPSNNWDETGTNTLNVVDNDLPELSDTTSGTPTTGEPILIRIEAQDNIDIYEVYLYYYFNTTSGFTLAQNVTMNDIGDGNYTYQIDVPSDALVLYYNISANDTSDNWNETGETAPNVQDNDVPALTDTTAGSPTTGESFLFTAQATDNINVSEVHAYFWFETTTGNTTPMNVTMNDLGSGNFNYSISVPANALALHYNISAVDLGLNWNETGENNLDVEDNDLPEISNANANPLTQVIGNQVNITVNIADDIGIFEVTLNITFPDDSYILENMTLAGGNTWYYSTIYDEPGGHNYTIIVNDTSANLNQSGLHQFTMTPPPPTVDYILIHTASNGGGEVAVNMTYNVTESDTFYAAAYNNSIGYIWDVEVTWFSSEPLIGSVSPSLGYSTNFSAAASGSGTVLAIFGLLNRSVSFEVLAPEDPEITESIPDIHLTEDFGLHTVDLSSYAYDPQGINTLQWYLTGVDTNIIWTLNENITGNHVIAFYSKNDMFGNMEVTYWLMDKDRHLVSKNAWINVTPVNDPPRIGDAPNLIVHYDNPMSFDYTPYMLDVDNTLSQLTLTVEDSNHVTQNGFTVTYNYPRSMLGTDVYVTLTVSDGHYTGSKLIKVTITSDNPPQTVSRLPDITLNENEVKLNYFDLDEYFTDPDGDTLQMSVGSSFVNIMIHEDHSVDFSATGEWGGTQMVTFRAKDTLGAVAEQTIKVTVIPENDPPQIKELPDLHVHYNRSYVFDLVWFISDRDNEIEELTITTSNDNNVTVNRTRLTLFYPDSWDGQSYPYTVSLTIYVSDGAQTTSQEIDVYVTGNYPPESLMSLDDVTFNEDENLTYVYDLDDYFFDWEGDTLTYTYDSEYIEITIHDNNTIDISSPPNWFGWEMIMITAEDDSGAFLVDIIMVTVLPVNDGPLISDIPLQVGKKGEEWVLDLSLYISDIDNELSNLSVSVAGAYVELVGYVLIFHYPENVTEDTVWITVSDGELETTTAVNVIIESPTVVPDIGAWLLSVPPIILIVVLLVLFLITRGIYVLEDLFLITKSGLLIEHAGTERDYEKGDEQDEDILAGMFVAVQEFIRDSFGGEEEHLKRLDYGDKTVLIYRGNHLILAGFLSGALSKPFYRKMKFFVEDVEERYTGKVEDWSGNIEDLPKIELMMKSLLAGKYPKGYKNNKIEDDEEEEEEEEEKKEDKKEQTHESELADYFTKDS